MARKEAMKRTQSDRSAGREKHARREARSEEFYVLLSPDGTAVFSWNTPDIQRIARRLGIAEFDPPTWCG